MMAEVYPEKPLVRCSGCGFSHTECLSQQEAVRFLHRAVELLEFLAHQAPQGPTPGVRALLDEYEEVWS
jgi:hypothetical protein